MISANGYLIRRVAERTSDAARCEPALPGEFHMRYGSRRRWVVIAIMATIAGVTGFWQVTASRNSPDPGEMADPRTAGALVASDEGTGSTQRNEGDQPSFSLSERVARNHLVVIGRVIRDAGEAEYTRVDLKTGATGQPSEAAGSPGVRTRLREVEVVQILNGMPTGSPSVIVVEELYGTAVTEVGQTYLFLLSPWHSGTYQAGEYGALMADGDGVAFASGESVSSVFPETAGLGFDEMVNLVTTMVQSQRSEAGELAVVSPIPGRTYDARHLWSLDAAASVTVGGRVLDNSAVRALAAALTAPLEPRMAAAGPGDGEPVEVEIVMESGQRVRLAFNQSSRSIVPGADGVELPLPPAAAALLTRE